MIFAPLVAGVTLAIKLDDNHNRPRTTLEGMTGADGVDLKVKFK